MANFDFLTLVSGKQKRIASNANTVDFLSIKVGASGLEILEATGHFDFSAKKLTNIADGTAATHAASYGQVILKNGTNAFTADQSLGGFKLTNLADPTSAQDAATKAYVDGVATGLDVKKSVRALSSSNITLSGAQTIDGVSIIAGDRVLVAGQTTGSENGIYVAAAGAWSRSTDADSNAEVNAGMFTFVEEGTTYQDSGWVLSTNDPIVLGTTSLAFSQFSGAGSIVAGAGLLKTGNTIDVVSANTGIVANADNIELSLATSSGLEISSGLKIKPDVTTADTLAITLTSNGAGTKYDSNSFTESSESLALAAGVAGAGLALTTGVLSVNVSDGVQIVGDNVTAKVSDIAGDGLEDDGANNLRLKASVAGDGLAHSAGILSVNTGDGTKILSDAVVADYAETKTNDNAGSITVRQVVYVKANGAVDLAIASVALNDAEIGVVQDASIATTASGKITFRRGAKIGGFTGLTPGKIQYVSRSSAGALTESLSGFVAGEAVQRVGRALSATELLYDPEFEFEF